MMKKLLPWFSKQAQNSFDEQKLKLWERKIKSLYNLLVEVYGSDKLVLKAGKLDALDLVKSSSIEDKLVALQRLVFDDPTIDGVEDLLDVPEILNEIEEEIADLLARKKLEKDIEKKVARKMRERQDEYIQELKKQIIKEKEGPDNSQTLKKYALLEKLEHTGLSRSTLEILRPGSLEEIVGQNKAVKALISKIASPYPQHVILYGPPGVGKTTVARLTLEEAKGIKHTPFKEDARFVEVDGTTLRWDPREVTNPLLGSVHDPIYQGAKKQLAESGIPEPKTGLVTEAHGGVLFIDEIGELDPLLQNKLLKVMEDKRVYFDSSYYNPDDENVPKYIKKLFEEGAPADFILIGATTRQPEEINPAFRSRTAEVFFEPLTPDDIQKIIENAAHKLGVDLGPGVSKLISEYTIEGRKAINILADAYGLLMYDLGKTKQEADARLVITRDIVYEVAKISRLTPYNPIKARATRETGKIFGLGVSGYLGTILEIEAVVFPAGKGKGQIRFNETAGSMAKDSVFNAMSVVRQITGKDLRDYDLHVNIVGGGRIDGPSAGSAIVVVIISALEGKPVPQDVALTGEISLQGRLKPVGGVVEKIYGAQRAGIKMVFIPWENRNEVELKQNNLKIVPVENVREVLAHIFVDKNKARLKHA